MADDGSAGSQLSNAASFIKIGSRDWKISETIYSKGVDAVKIKKMRETFGEQWATVRVKESLSGKVPLGKFVCDGPIYKFPKKLSMDPISKSSKTHQRNQGKTRKKLSIILR
jgi:hypothetical protein